jgi:hypothetical protein
LVGPEKYTAKVFKILDEMNERRIKIKSTKDLKPEEAGRLRNQDLVYVLFVMDSCDPMALKDVDEQLTYLHKNYLLAFERIDFLLVKV